MPLVKGSRRDAAPAPREIEPCGVPDLLNVLRRGATPAERRDAAHALAAWPETASELAAALPAEAHISVRTAITAVLIEIGTEAAAAGLSAHLRSEDVALRNAAVEALQQMGEAAGAHVRSLLDSQEPDMRIFAVNVLEALSHRAASSWLRKLLTRETEMNVGLAAVEALAQIGGPEDEPALRGFAARNPDEPFVQFAVGLACRRVAAGAGA